MAVDSVVISVQAGSTMVCLLLPVFFLLCSVSTETSFNCSLQGALDQPAFMSDGDIIIGGIFPLHYRMELPKTDFRSKPLAAQCQG